LRAGVRDVCVCIVPVPTAPLIFHALRSCWRAGFVACNADDENGFQTRRPPPPCAVFVPTITAHATSAPGRIVAEIRQLASLHGSVHATRVRGPWRQKHCREMLFAVTARESTRVACTDLDDGSVSASGAFEPAFL